MSGRRAPAIDWLACIRPYLVPGAFGGCLDCYQIEQHGRPSDRLPCECCGVDARMVVHSTLMGADSCDTCDYQHHDVCEECYDLVVAEYVAGGGMMDGIK